MFAEAAIDLHLRDLDGALSTLQHTKAFDTRGLPLYPPLSIVYVRLAM